MSDTCQHCVELGTICWACDDTPREYTAARPVGAEFASTDWLAELEAALSHARKAKEMLDEEKLHVFSNIADRAVATLEGLTSVGRRHSASDGSERRAPEEKL